MKFKIGDKVRVVNNTGDKFEGVKVGDIGEVVDIGNKSYDYDVYLKINKHTLYGFKQEELELYKEDKMEKTFKEVIADIKDGEVWVQTKENCVTGRISCIEGEIIIDLTQARSSFGTLGTYKLQRKEYTFEEAFKAYEEGKEIQSIATGVKCQRRRLPYENEVKDYCYYSDNLKEFAELKEFTISEIKGLWYINELR